MYRYFRAEADCNIYWRLNVETDIVQHVVTDCSDLWADPLRSVIHGANQMQMALDRGEVVEIDYNPINTDETEDRRY